MPPNSATEQPAPRNAHTHRPPPLPATETTTTAQRMLANRLSYSRAGSFIAAALVMAALALDELTYPERLEELARIRVITSLLLIGAWGLLQTQLGARFVKAISIGWLVIPQLMLVWMIYSTDGAASLYFVGLLFALFAVGTGLPMSSFESAIFGTFSLAVYAAACMAHSEQSGIAIGANFFAQSLIIALAVVTTTLCAWISERARARMFSLKEQLSLKNTELQEVNHALSQIKGQLLERERMAAIGDLSTSLLQELNNPVNACMLGINQGLSMSGVKRDKLLTESLQDARASLDRVHTIVSDLRTFAHPAPSGEAHQPFALHKAVRLAMRLASSDLKGVPVGVFLPNEAMVLGEEPAVIGVLINLLSNAGHAAKSINRPHPKVLIKGELNGNRVRISVRDNGPGIEKSVVDRVFDPFFNTRGIGTGLGLGLGMSQTIVRRHDSELVVKSEAGAWTEFSFDIAIAPEAAEN